MDIIPNIPPPPSPISAGVPAPLPPPPPYQPSPSRKWPYIVIPIAILLIVAIVWFLLSRGKNTGAGPGGAAAAPTMPAGLKDRLDKVQNFNASMQAIGAQDTDFDGLSNSDEAKLGTDPNNPDTDGDGLLDRDEVKIYKTNPLKADTYGIGHTDGWGVRHGIILPDGKVKK